MSIICDACGTRDREKFSNKGIMTVILLSEDPNFTGKTPLPINMDICNDCLLDESASEADVVALLVRVVGEAEKNGLAGKSKPKKRTKPKPRAKKKDPKEDNKSADSSKSDTTSGDSKANDKAEVPDTDGNGGNVDANNNVSSNKSGGSPVNIPRTDEF